MSYCYLNGKFLEIDQAHLSIKDRGFLLADGLFETMIAVKGRIRCLNRHMERLNRGLDFFSMPLSGLKEHIENVYPILLKKNNLFDSHSSLRLTISRGEGLRGLLPPIEVKPTVLLTAQEILPNNTSLSLILSSFRRNTTSPLSAFKTLNYQNEILARIEASQNWADDAIMNNSQNRPICTSVGNLFLIHNQKIITPPLAEGILPGITREIVLNILKDKQIPYHVNPIQPSLLQEAEAGFVTNSLVGIHPIRQIAHSKLDPTHIFIIQLKTEYEKFLQSSHS